MTDVWYEIAAGCGTMLDCNVWDPGESYHCQLCVCLWHAVWGRIVRILRQIIENFACITCKFCAPFLWILRKFCAHFQADFSTMKLSVAFLYDSVCHIIIPYIVCSFVLCAFQCFFYFLMSFSTRGSSINRYLFWCQLTMEVTECM